MTQALPKGKGDLQAPQEIELTVNDLARGGAGVARDESGRVVFIPFTAPGDRVRVRIVEENKRYAQGVLLEVLEPSPIRQTPPCPLFGRCGGCQWQHLPYELQWKTKAGGVVHAMSRIGLPKPSDWQEFPAEKIWEYRNRIQVRGLGSQMGFFRAGSHELVPAERCDIARPELNSAWSQTRIEGARLQKPYRVELEILPEGGIRKTWDANAGAAGFRQVHDEQNEKLRAWIAGSLTPGARLLDLYGGNGNLSLPLAGKMASIDVVDTGAPAQKPAGTPANLEFHRSGVLPWLLRRDKAAEAAIIDPPREGLGKDLPEIASRLERLGVRELVAVGCDPDAWIRDLSGLLKRGWAIRKAATLDFFPQTPHVESVALCVR